MRIEMTKRDISESVHTLRFELTGEGMLVYKAEDVGKVPAEFDFEHKHNTKQATSNRALPVSTQVFSSAVSCGGQLKSIGS